MVDQLVGGERLWMRSQMIAPITKQLTGRDIEGEVELLIVADGVSLPARWLRPVHPAPVHR